MRRPDLSSINVVDVEATCWQHGPPPGQTQEIIEIGICVLNAADGTPVEHGDLLVKPARSVVSAFCTELTSLTQEAVDEGIAFEAACGVLREQFHARERVWASYGDFDRRLFESQCQEFGVAYPFGRRHLNVKSLLALVLGLPREVGMAEALDLLGLPLEGQHHRAGDDVRNIAAILARLLLAAREGLSRA